MSVASRFTHWYRAKATVPFRGGSVTPFGVSEFNASGLNVLALIHIIAGRSGDDIWRPSTNIGSLGPGSDAMLDGYNLEIDRVRIPPNANHVTLNRATGGVGWNTLFAAGEALADASVWVQLEGQTRVELDSSNLNSAGGGFIRYNPDTTEQAIIDGIVAGTELLLAITTPA